jgi:DNA-binding XRE family transcriptional regulator
MGSGCGFSSSIQAISAILGGSIREEESMLPERHVMHGRLVRAARVLLGWNQEQLAGAAGVSVGTIRDLENGRSSPRGRCVSAIRQALERGGIRFIDATHEHGQGVRYERPGSAAREGHEF